MNVSGRIPARSSASGRPTPPTILAVVATGILLALAGWRWHEAEVSAPMAVAELEGPAWVLVVQPGDCPDRRAAVEGWLSALGSAGEGHGPGTVHLAVLEDPGLRLPTALDTLPRLSPAATRRAARAVRRSGASGTPALLLLDADGHPAMALTFEQGGPDAALVQALRHLTLRLAEAAFLPSAPEETFPWNL